MSPKPDLSPKEFITLMALLTSLAAFAVDAMLPALAQIGEDLQVKQDNARQLIISCLLLGMGFGQLVFGPLADTMGRKPPVYIGLSCFIVGTLLSMLSQSMPVMLAGRLLQGFGAAAPRVVCLALVRDKYEGEAMARVLSFITALFILVPVVAPAVGQFIISHAHWRAIFAIFLIFALIIFAWFLARQPETLARAKRRPFSIQQMTLACSQVVKNKAVIGYALASGFIFAGMLNYINLSQQIFQERYELGKQFPLFFGVLALTLSLASMVNAKLVVHFGLRKLLYMVSSLKSALSFCFLLVTIHWQGLPPLALIFTYLVLMFFLIGLSFGNFNAMAMKPLAHMAGIGAAVVGCLSLLVSVVFSLVFSQMYSGNIYPLVIGFCFFGTAAFVCTRWADSN